MTFLLTWCCVDATAASLSSHSTATDNATAAAAFQSAIAGITSAVTDTTASVTKLSAKRHILARQTDHGALATLVVNLLLEISGALNSIIATLGLSKCCSYLCR
jgi:hypothetical protein